MDCTPSKQAHRPAFCPQLLQTLVRQIGSIGCPCGQHGGDGALAHGRMIPNARLAAQVRLPLAEYLSVPTGRQAERRVIRTPLCSFADREEPEYLVCDREIETLPVGGAWFPVALERETFAEVYLEKSLRDPEDVKREGARAALNQLNLLAIHDETVDKWLNFSMIERDIIVVEATAEVARQIAQPGGDMLLSP